MNRDRLQLWLEQNYLPVVLALVGLVLLGAGVFWLRTGRQPETQVEILSTSTDQNQSKDIFIDVSGAVNQPGVYQLEAGSRVEDALRAAGGLAVEADNQWVEANLNRAMILVDGTKIYIPTPVKTASEKIRINSASKSELESLPGIGPVTAEKIIAGRPYQTLEELISKKILGQKTWGTIKDLVALW